MVGKYINHKDAYLSVVESLNHAGIQNKVRVRIRAVEAEEIEEKGAEKVLSGVHGVIVPGGFGARGIEGKIEAARYARERRIPYLGLCLGMQVAVVDFARNVCGIKDASSAEIDESAEHQVIHLMEEQRELDEMGGTMRLGAYPCTLVKNTRSYEAYNVEVVNERHRHRYEFNNAYRQEMEKAGLKIAGVYKEKDLVEIVEIQDHPWFVGVQFHPEFRSRPVKPHPLLLGLFGRLWIWRKNNLIKRCEGGTTMKKMLKLSTAVMVLIVLFLGVSSSAVWAQSDDGTSTFQTLSHIEDILYGRTKSGGLIERLGNIEKTFLAGNCQEASPNVREQFLIFLKKEPPASLL